MYRSKKGKDTKTKSATSPTALVHDAAAESAATGLAAVKKALGSHGATSSAAVAHPQATPSITGAGAAAGAGVGDRATAQAVVRLKASFTTPSMVYNPATKAIEVNAQFDRSAVAELSRAQGAMLGVLREAQGKPRLSTPKELLYGLERALLFLLSSTAVPDNEASLVPIGSDFDADGKLPTLESFFAHHTAPAKSIAATAYALSEGISKRAVESYLQTLKGRVEEEADPVAEKRRTAEESKAFAATRNNLTDFTQIFSNFLVAYESIPRAASSAHASLAQANAVSAETQLASADLLSEAYYSLLRWVLAVDPERRSLVQQQQHMSFAASQVNAAAPAKENSTKVVVTEYDAYRGHITLTRPTSTTPWGCMFNGKGHLVGISNDLRNSSEAGERLFRALQHHSGAELGLPVLEANRRRIRPQTMSEEELQAQRGNITTGLRDSLTSEAKVLHLTVPPESQESLTAPQEVVFELMGQGGENVNGQRVLLVLRRANTAIPWGVKMVKDTTGALKLQEFSDHIQLSARAKDFLFEHRGGLTIVGLNHRELADHHEAVTGASLRELIANSLAMALWLQVSRAAAEAVSASTTDPAPHTVAPTHHHHHDDDDGEMAGTENAEEAEVEDGDGEEEEAAEVKGEKDEENDAVEGSAREPVQLRETAALATTAKAVANQSVISSLRKGWELDDGEEENEQGEPGEAAADDDEEREHRELLEEHGVAADDDHHDADIADDTDRAEEVGEGEGAEEEEVDVLEGQRGFAATAAIDATRQVPPDLEAAVQDILETEMAGERLDGEAAVGTEEVAEAAPKKRGRKPGSKNAKAAKKKKTKGKEKAKRGRKPKKATDTATAAAEGEEEEAADADAEEPEEEQEQEGDEKEVEETAGAAEEEEGGVAEAIGEEPLVKGLKTSAEIAVEKGEERSSKRKSAKAKNADAAGDGETRMSIADLVDASPLVFPNQVTMTEFDGANMTLTRPDVSLPWQIKVGFAGDDMVLTGLPAGSGDAGVPADHPYLRYIEPFATAEKGGKGRCLVESVNGIDLATVTKATRHKVFDLIRNSPSLKMVVKFVRKR